MAEFLLMYQEVVCSKPVLLSSIFRNFVTPFKKFVDVQVTLKCRLTCAWMWHGKYTHLIISYNFIQVIPTLLSCLFSLFDWLSVPNAHKMKFSFKNFFSNCDQIRSFVQLCSYLLKISLMENIVFCAVFIAM